MMTDLRLMMLRVPTMEQAHSTFDSLGFALDETRSTCILGNVQVDISSSDSGPYGFTTWKFSGERSGKVRLDPNVLPPTYFHSVKKTPVPDTHINGVTAIDRVVVMVPSLPSAVAGLESFVGIRRLKLTNIRGVQTAFMKAGKVTLELLEIRQCSRPFIWGLAFRVTDLDATLKTITRSGGTVSEPTKALQGGRIATTAPDACFGVSLAFTEPAST